MTYEYTSDDHNTWKKALEKQLPLFEKYACKEYLQGFKDLSFELDVIPNITHLSQMLFNKYNWRLIPVEHYINAQQYLAHISEFELPVVLSMRPNSSTEFYQSESPDLLHEVLGHCPFLTNVEYSKFINKMACFATQYLKDQHEFDLFSKFYYLTIEFGVIYNSLSELKVYGAAILPSYTEMQNAIKFGNKNKLNIEDVLSESYKIGEILQKYYYVSSLEDLYDINLYEVVEHIKLRTTCIV